MAAAQTTDLFQCTPTQFYAIISDYEKYPQFLSEVKNCRLVSEQSNKKLVEFEISIIKTFRYSLWMTETAPHNIHWEFASGDLFKKSTGSWVLSDEAGMTRAEYAIDAQFNLFVPGPIAKALVSVNLPNMMSAYHKRVRELY